jgi:predicted metal-dependent hydrolase
LNKNKVTVSKQVYHHGDQKIEYTLFRSKRRKTSEIMVDEDQIIVRVPSEKSSDHADKLVHGKIRWIINKQKEYRQKRPEITKPTFFDGSKVPYLGHNYEIRIIKDRNNNNDRIELENDKFVVTLSSKSSQNGDDNRIKLLYEDWLYHQAKNIFEKRIKRFGSKIDVSPKKIVLKNLRNRWGSVTKEGTINLNYNLIKAPDEVIDYIIIHELCHFLIKDHSHRYWNLLKAYVKDYKRKIEWLEINGKYLV